MLKQVWQPRRFGLPVILIVSAAMMLAGAVPVAAQPKKPAAVKTAGQTHFDTPKAAVDALFAAFKARDEAMLVAIFGPDHDKLIELGDAEARQEAMRELVQAFSEKNNIEKQADGSMMLVLGRKNWPFPIPLVQADQGWRFDTAAGVEEILNRRIGENEIETIENCRAYLAAQALYARRDHDGDEVREYAQKIRSTPGKQDGLYWEADAASGEEISPFGELLAEAALNRAKEAEANAAAPFNGYYYRILTRQGANAPGGEYDYIINGNMIAGFAIVAWPAEYGVTGVMTFVASHHGKVYEKDYGEKTTETVKAMTAYNPDKTWKPAAQE